MDAEDIENIIGYKSSMEAEVRSCSTDILDSEHYEFIELEIDGKEVGVVNVIEIA
jgi:predicted HTH transcriptional regulator